jgi:hypothetical protein
MNDHWSQLSRAELTAFGRTIVTELLEGAGCTVKPPAARASGKLDVTTPSGRPIEVFVSTQRVGGYAFWTKRRFPISADRFAAIVLLSDAADPDVYLVPSTEWRTADPPLKDRPNVGKRSDPEYGVSLARSSLPELERYRWDDEAGREHLR